MTTATDVNQPTLQPAASSGRRMSLPVLLLVIAGGLALTSIVRIITGADGITNVSQMSTALELAVPIGLAGLGGLWAERSGVVNIGLEGMMILGTWFGAWAGYQWGPWTGILVGVIGGAVGGLLHAIMTVTFNVNHIVSGVAINILALGATRYLSPLAFEGVPGGSAKQSPPVESLGQFTVPGLSDWLTTLNSKGWFFVSDPRVCSAAWSPTSPG
jgi:simple sugar transport system permease protein